MYSIQIWNFTTELLEDVKKLSQNPTTESNYYTDIASV